MKNAVRRPLCCFLCGIMLLGSTASADTIKVTAPRPANVPQQTQAFPTAAPMTVEQPQKGTDEAIVLQALEEALDGYRASDTGWGLDWINRIEITDISTDAKGYVNITCRYPLIPLGLKASVRVGDDPDGYISSAMSGYLEPAKWQEFTIVATIKDGQVKYINGQSPAKLRTESRSAASSSKSSFSVSNFYDGVLAYMIRHSTKMPSSKPQEPVALLPLDEAFATPFAEALGLPVQEASMRLAPIFLLLSGKSCSVNSGLQNAVIQIVMKSWKTMLESAESALLTAMDTMVGAPAISRETMSRLLFEQVENVFSSAYYTSKGTTTLKLDLDLPAAAAGQLATACPGLTDELWNFSCAWDDALDRLMDNAAQRDFFIPLAIPDSVLLSGSDSTAANTVSLSFGMGTDTTHYAWVCLQNDKGHTLYTGFVGQLARLNTHVVPGCYTVYYGKGAEWYGQDYLFGPDAEYGRFELTIPDKARNTVYLGGDSGSIEPAEAEWKSLCPAPGCD